MRGVQKGKKKSFFKLETFFSYCFFFFFINPFPLHFQDDF